ncbi:MAG: S9 family peptidase [Melioribacteraceae bacterium]|nr:S9 family peptidase [Melioribacteraceae bacterium]MCF8353022.1 S9 family peptidase [Melioribacteraceae bacterium]MCF8392913.1 S9 family peptidase [Melioribacteraceae bacterium]MCF8417793.1 S9 family peptidase [Melioribacteraceae bacterium]
MKSFKIILFIFISLTLFLSLPAQQKYLTYSQVYSGGQPRLLETLPRISGWYDNNTYLEMKIDMETKSSQLLKVDAETGESEVYIDFSKFDEILPRGSRAEYPADRNDDYTKMIFEIDGDIYFYEEGYSELKRLTASTAEENNASFSPDYKYVAYTREHNLFALELETGLEHQITNDGSETVYNGWASWVYYEEILGRRSRYKSFWWSPNSNKIAFLKFDDSPVPKFPLYRADGTHGELEWEHYPKAGDPNPYVELGIADLQSGEIVWVDSDPLADHYIAWPFWTPDGNRLLFQWMNRGQDNLKIFSTDPDTGNKTQIYDEKQDAWVEFFENIHFVNDGKSFLINSNKNGWNHVYHYSIDGQLINQITDGDWAVNGIELIDEENEILYFRGTKETSTENHLYKIKFDGSDLTKLTSESGNHSTSLSPDGSFFTDRFSSVNTPNKFELRDGDGNFIRVIGDAKSEAFDDYNLGKAELFTVPTDDGFDLPVKWILPPDFDEDKKYPVVFSIYGGPAAQTVWNSFPYWLNDFYLAQNGIIMISADHRGSGHFGKKGVALMHRQLGKYEIDDLTVIVDWLKSKSFVDTTKIAVTGGSYGGYATCMALTYGADYFTHGVAHFSVTDWHLYDNVYTERYMDTPEENPEGYEFGSAMTHAEKYKGKLLITHGTMDDNVHMQNTMQFISKLQDLDKDFELMLYPNARHGVGYPKRPHFMREELEFWFHNLLNKEITRD